jgi:hypothetical protein
MAAAVIIAVYLASYRALVKPDDYRESRSYPGQAAAFYQHDLGLRTGLRSCELDRSCAAARRLGETKLRLVADPSDTARKPPDASRTERRGSWAGRY